MIIVYSDTRFYWDALHGKAYQYWWEIMLRTIDYQMYNTAGLAGVIEFKR